MARYVIAIDAMGGDNAPKAILRGIDYFCKTYPFIDNVHFLIYGQRQKLGRILRHRKYKYMYGNYDLIDTPDIVPSDARLADILKKSQNTSMWQAIKAVKDKKADAVISCGNTGCYMAFSKLQLRMLEDIKRPALTTVIPTKFRANTVMLDLGANLEHTSTTLIDYAIMGSVYSSIINNIDRPSVGLLNIGEEDSKGNEIIRKVHNILTKIESTTFKYHGFVEGHDITLGTTDVVVTDGWTGNIALKSIEGTAKFIGYMVKNAFKGHSLWSKFWGALAYLLIRKSMNRIANKIDIRRHNGAIFAGLNGIVVKSHGSSDYLAFYYAIHYALNFAQHKLNDKIKIALQDYYKKHPKEK